jgi:hypothetical protein
MKTNSGKSYIKTLCTRTFDLGGMVYAYNRDKLEGYENCVKADIAVAIGILGELIESIRKQEFNVFKVGDLVEWCSCGDFEKFGKSKEIYERDICVIKDIDEGRALLQSTMDDDNVEWSLIENIRHYQMEYEFKLIRAEVMEQARLLGMSAERECALLGEIERLKKKILILESKVEPEPEYEEFVPEKKYPVGGFFKIKNEVFKIVSGVGTCENCEFSVKGRCINSDFKCSGVNAILYDTLED